MLGKALAELADPLARARIERRRDRVRVDREITVSRRGETLAQTRQTILRQAREPQLHRSRLRLLHNKPNASLGVVDRQRSFCLNHAGPSILNQTGSVRAAS